MLVKKKFIPYFAIIPAIIVIALLSYFFKIPSNQTEATETKVLKVEDVTLFTEANPDFKAVNDYSKELGFNQFVEAKEVTKAGVKSTYITYSDGSKTIMAVKDSSAEYSISYLTSISYGGDQVLLSIFDKNSAITLDLTELKPKETSKNNTVPNKKQSHSKAFGLIPKAYAVTFVGYEVGDADPQCLINQLKDSLEWAKLTLACQQCVNGDDNKCLKCQQDLGEQMTDNLKDSILNLCDMEAGGTGADAGTDVRITEVRFNPAYPRAYQSFNVEFDLKNYGKSASSKYWVEYKLYRSSGSFVHSSLGYWYNSLGKGSTYSDFKTHAGTGEGNYDLILNVGFVDVKSDFPFERYGYITDVWDTFTRPFTLYAEPEPEPEPQTTEEPSVPATAHIDHILPSPAIAGDTIKFRGHGVYPDGKSDRYKWYVKKLNTVLANLSTDFWAEDITIDTSVGYLGKPEVGLVGTHEICFSVYDLANSSWSARDCQNFEIKEKPVYKPIAYIDTINPNPATEGEIITLNGSGADPDGNITRYNWLVRLPNNTIINLGPGFLTEDITIDTSLGYLGKEFLDIVGTHQICYKVYDEIGDEWSEETCHTLTIIEKANQKPIIYIDSITPNPASVNITEVTVKGHGIDYDGTIVECKIDFGDGEIVTTQADTCEATHIYSEAGTKEIRLTVTDNQGASIYVLDQIAVQGLFALSGTVIWNPATVKEGEDSTYTVSITNDGQVDVEISQIHAFWYWDQGEGYQLAEEEDYYPSVPPPWFWLTGSIPVGETKEVFTHTGPTEGVGGWYVSLFAYTDQGNTYILNTGYLTIE